jgi:hypothetical protein
VKSNSCEIKTFTCGYQQPRNMRLEMSHIRVCAFFYTHSSSTENDVESYFVLYICIYLHLSVCPCNLGVHFFPLQVKNKQYGEIEIANIYVYS